MYRLVNGFKLVICIVDGIQCFGLTDPKHYFFAPVRCLFGYLQYVFKVSISLILISQQSDKGPILIR